MTLRDLHTPVPLRDGDYAAIRARVIGEIVARRRRWRFAIAFATAATIAFALWLKRPADVVAPALLPPRPPAPIAKIEPAPEATAPAIAPVKFTPKPRKHVKPEPLRIELHTHDPEIRIIWIVNATKEES